MSDFSAVVKHRFMSSIVGIPALNLEVIDEVEVWGDEGAAEGGDWAVVSSRRKSKQIT